MAIRNSNTGFIALVLIDAALKAAAQVWLRHRDILVSAAGPIRLGYLENGSGFGFDQERLLGRYGVAIDDAFVVCTLAVFLLLALVVFLWHRIKAKAWIKTAVGAVFYLAAAAIALALHDSVRLSLTPYFRGFLRALGPLAVAFVLYYSVEKPYYKAMSLLFLAGTVGNCLSLVLPPFAVIDYFGLYRSSIHSYVYGNAADAYLLAAALMAVLIPVYLIARGLYERRPRARR